MSNLFKVSEHKQKQLLRRVLPRKNQGTIDAKNIWDCNSTVMNVGNSQFEMTPGNWPSRPDYCTENFGLFHYKCEPKYYHFNGVKSNQQKYTTFKNFNCQKHVNRCQ